jgi:DNA-binding IclR family transcriptional regulator
MLRVSDLAHELNLTRSAAYRLAQSLPHLKVNRTVLVERSDLELALAAMKREATR